MKPTLNQRGSVLLIVMVAAAVCVLIISTLMMRLSSLAENNKEYNIARENVRVGDELAKIIALAYENGRQIAATSGAAACTASGGVAMNTGSESLCFSNTAAQRCIPTRWRNVCFKSMTPRIIGFEGGEKYRWDAISKPARANARVSLFLPTASAQMEDSGQPAAPTGITNTAAAITCPGSDICRRCGTKASGAPFFCFEIAFCKVNWGDDTTCAAEDMFYHDVMIAR